MVGVLLARQGVEVLVLEKHADYPGWILRQTLVHSGTEGLVVTSQLVDIQPLGLGEHLVVFPVLYDQPAQQVIARLGLSLR
jgi:hypothetical protein